MRFADGRGGEVTLEPGELVACIQIGHTYRHHAVTEHCLLPHPVERRCGYQTCPCKRAGNTQPGGNS